MFLLLFFRKSLFLMFFLVNTVFLVTNITSSFLYYKEPKASYQQIITIVRVSLDYTLFFVSAVILCWCIIRVSMFSILFTSFKALPNALNFTHLEYLVTLNLFCITKSLEWISHGSHNFVYSNDFLEKFWFSLSGGITKEFQLELYLSFSHQLMPYQCWIWF